MDNKQTNQQAPQGTESISPKQPEVSNPTSEEEEERLRKLDSQFEEECEESVTVGRDGTVYTIPQRPYKGLAESAEQQWADYNARMEKIDAQRAKERAERRERFKQEDAKSAQLIKKMKDDVIAREQERAAMHGTLQWFTEQIRGKAGKPFDPLRLDADEQTLQIYLKEAVREIVVENGDDFNEDSFIKQYICLAAKWMHAHTKMGLILRGNVGVGKTTLAKAMSLVYMAYLGRGFRILDAVRISHIAQRDDEMFMDVCKTPMLVIDDLGTEPYSVKNYGNEATPIIELLTFRHAHRMFTIITTNLAVSQDGQDEIFTRYGKRVGDRLTQLCSTLKFDGSQKSYRK